MGEGDGDVGEDDGGVGEDRGDDDGPGSVPTPPEARGREPPFFFFFLFFLDLLPRWEKGSPLVLGLHGVGGARAPPRLDLSLCLSLFLRSQILPSRRFFYIRRSVTPIGLKPSHRFFSKN